MTFNEYKAIISAHETINPPLNNSQLKRCYNAGIDTETIKRVRSRLYNALNVIIDELSDK